MGVSPWLGDGVGVLQSHRVVEEGESKGDGESSSCKTEHCIKAHCYLTRECCLICDFKRCHYVVI